VSFNSKLRDELLDGEFFYSLAKAAIVIETWRRHYNTKRPHSLLGYRPSAPVVIQRPASPSGAASPATPAVAPRPVIQQDCNRTARSGRASNDAGVEPEGGHG